MNSYTWADWKSIVNSNDLPFSYSDNGRNYIVVAKNSYITATVLVSKLTDLADLADFETNYKPKALTSFMEQSVYALMARCKADTVSGVATALLPLPSEARVVSGGQAIFGNTQWGDYATADIYDAVNDLVISSWADLSVDSQYRGWYMLPGMGANMEPLITNDAKTLPANSSYHLRVIGYKADVNQADTLYVNVRWGKRIR